MTCDRHRPRLPGPGTPDAARHRRQRSDDAVPAQDREHVRFREARLRAERGDEGRVERHRNGDRPHEAAPGDDSDLAGRRERGRASDVEAAGRGDRDVPRALEHLRDCRPVAAFEPLLERRCAGKRRGATLRAVHLLLVGREPGAEAPLEPRVDLPGLTLPRDAREPPEGGRQWQQREHNEVDDELELEATEHAPPHTHRCSSTEALLPIPHSSDVVGSKG